MTTDHGDRNSPLLVTLSSLCLYPYFLSFRLVHKLPNTIEDKVLVVVDGNHDGGVRCNGGEEWKFHERIDKAFLERIARYSPSSDLRYRHF